ncbi:MAG: hypothetical protein ACYSUN_11055 [Planctomycetota bacterium]|jgi:hypothetical protein
MSNETPNYSKEIDKALNAFDGQDTADFVALALACLDQAMLSVEEQGKVYNLLSELKPDLMEEVANK